MSGARTRVVTAGHAGRAIAPRVTWCYLGTDVSARERLRQAHGDEVPVGLALTEIAIRLKQPFLDWIARLGADQRDPASWWASALASKSPLQCDLFFLVCYGEALATWADRGSPVQVVVIEDPWLWSVAHDWFRSSPAFTFAGGSGWTRHGEVARLRLRSLWAALAFVAWSVRARADARRAVPRTSGAWPAGGALILTWIEPRAFAADGAFHDPYTGRLEALLADDGRRVSRLTPLLVPRQLWPAVRRAPGRFVVAAAFLRFGDIIRSAAGFRVDHAGRHRIFAARDHGGLLRRQRLIETAGLAFRQHRLWYRAVQRIASAAAGSGTTVLYPFENQPHEKLLCLAWRAAAPDAAIAGYVTAGIPTLLLSFFLGVGEDTLQPLPDRIVTNGPASRDLLAANGYPADRLVDGGAFRFEHLAAAAGGHARRGDTAARRVIVALSTVDCYSRELVLQLMEECRTPLRDAAGRDVEFVLTFHVDLPASALLGPAPQLPPSLSVSQRSLNDLVPESDLCLFAPPTGSWREALFAGLPVLRYRPDLLDLDPTDSLGGPAVPDCTRATLRQAIVAALAAPHALSGEEARRMLRRVYSPVQEQVWRSLVGPLPEPVQ